MIHREDFQALYLGSLQRILRWNEHGFASDPAGQQGHGQHPFDRPNPAIECQFTQRHDFLMAFCIQLSACRKHPQRHGKVEAGSLLSDIGGCQIDGHVSFGHGKAARQESRTDSIAGFANGHIR